MRFCLAQVASVREIQDFFGGGTNFYLVNVEFYEWSYFHFSWLLGNSELLLFII